MRFFYMIFKKDAGANHPLTGVNNTKMFYTYFAKSLKNNKIYVGVTEKPPQDRIIDHNSGSNKWSKQNGPLKLIYYESYYCKKDALNREKFYKSGFGRKIRDIIVDFLENNSSGCGSDG